MRNDVKPRLGSPSCMNLHQLICLHLVKKWCWKYIPSGMYEPRPLINSKRFCIKNGPPGIQFSISEDRAIIKEGMGIQINPRRVMRYSIKIELQKRFKFSKFWGIEVFPRKPQLSGTPCSLHTKISLTSIYFKRQLFFDSDPTGSGRVCWEV